MLWQRGRAQIVLFHGPRPSSILLTRRTMAMQASSWPRAVPCLQTELTHRVMGLSSLVCRAIAEGRPHIVSRHGYQVELACLPAFAATAGHIVGQLAAKWKELEREREGGAPSSAGAETLLGWEK
jgi:hypothetical protein